MLPGITGSDIKTHRKHKNMEDFNVNSSKKTLKNQNKKEPRRPLAESTGIGKKIAGGICVAVVLLVIVIVAVEGLTPKYLMEIDGKKLKKEDLMYEIYEAESLGAYMANMYTQFGYSADEYWTMDMGDGTTAQDSLKNDVIESAAETAVLYGEAKKEDYEPTEEEVKEASEEADRIIEELTEEKAKKIGLTKDFLTEQLEKQAIAERYKQDKIDGLDIDDEAIKAEIDYDTYRGYEVEYFYVSATTTDEEGNSLDAENKDSLKEELNAVVSKAEESDDWSKVIDSEDKDAVVSYHTETLVKGDSDNFGEDFMNKVMALKNGDVSEVIEVEADGYYVVRMKDNDSKSEYDTAVEEAITAKENEEFETLYDAMYEKHSVKVYDKNWSSIVFGTNIF